jgi:hypothetical protein
MPNASSPARDDRSPLPSCRTLLLTFTTPSVKTLGYSLNLQKIFTGETPLITPLDAVNLNANAIVPTNGGAKEPDRGVARCVAPRRSRAGNCRAILAAP